MNLITKPMWYATTTLNVCLANGFRAASEFPQRLRSSGPLSCPPTFAIFRPLVMTLTQLRTVLAIVDSGLNVTLAAERIHATQSGLSKQLRQLESGLSSAVERVWKR